MVLVRHSIGSIHFREMTVQSQGIVMEKCRVQGSQGRTVQGQGKVSLSHSGSRDRSVRWFSAQGLTDLIEKAHKYLNNLHTIHIISYFIFKC